MNFHIHGDTISDLSACWPARPGRGALGRWPLGLEGVVFADRASGAETGPMPLADAREWAAGHGLGDRLQALSGERSGPCGLSYRDRPLVMGIINVTPDSFYDGGSHATERAAIAHGHRLIEEGADILDIGGESTRPGADPVDRAEELRRVLPVIRELAGTGCPISIDTRHAAVMDAAIEAGARLINDVGALTEPGALATAARSGCPVIVMHMRGQPRTMQANPSYDDVLVAIRDFLEDRIEACRAAGMEDSRIIVDPGIGFGKTAAHNVEILQSMGGFHDLGCAVLVGASRKSFIGRLSRREPVGDRLAGSLTAALTAADQGVHILRVHDVAETVQSLNIWAALRGLSGRVGGDSATGPGLR